MQNELHERLEYLVNYSSQLIFVSGDSIAQQQKTLEAFVFQQHDDTEIAYLTAQDAMDVSDYRRQLCRQLLGQVVGSFVRPLNELLVELNNHEGPILIAITQSHHLPDTFLQELWDLVLQSRFAGNKQHLNVLLFADSVWAERAKQWLPAKNTETPLIISSQSVIDEQPRFESDLDKMIASRREAFQAHLESRQLQSTTSFANPLKSRWLYVALVLVFISTFAGLVYWQYGDDIASLFTPIEQVDDKTTPLIAPGSAYDTIATDDDTLLADKSSSDVGPSPFISGAEHVEVIGEKVIAEEVIGEEVIGESSLETSASDNSNTAGDANAITGDKVGNIEGATASASDIKTSDAAPDNNEANDTLASSEQALVTSWQEAISDSKESADAKESSQAAQTPGAQEPKAYQTEAVTTPTSNQSWIAPSEYALQLLAMKDPQVLNDFINEQNLRDITRIYKTWRYGGDWYVVVYYQPFASAEEAQLAKQQLPDYPNKASAFAKSGQQVIREVDLAKGE